METKANYVIVGAFTLLAFALIIAFAVWSAEKRGGGDVTRYSIEFKGSVSGLSPGNDVRFNGIKVGEVKSIKIDQNDPNIVRVIVSVDSDTPVREDSFASLETQGITGLSSIYISGGSKEARLLLPAPGHAMAEIVSHPSRLAALMDEAPDLVSSANKLLHNASDMFDEENKKNLRDILESMANVATALENRINQMEMTIRNLESASHKLGGTLDAANRAFSVDLTVSLNSMREATDSLNAMLRKMEPGLVRFSSNGLDETQRLIAEARSMVRNLDALAQKLNNDPQRLLFGDNLPEYKTK